MKGYKAFEKGMICRGKQYAENTIFEEEEAIFLLCVASYDEAMLCLDYKK